jgi:lysophospholipase L1-like esterase
MKTLRTSMMVVGGAMIFVALVAGWIGLSTPESFGRGQILLLSAGIVVLLIAFLSRADNAQDLRSFGHRMAEAYRKVAVLTLSALVLVALVELTAIGVSKILTPAEPEVAFSREKVSYYTSQDWAAQYWHEHQQSLPEQYHPYVLWRRVPFKGRTINIDPRGVRLTPGADCSANSYKVFTLGGSTMWGTGSPDWGTIPAYLQAGLEALRGKPVCVVNFGESGFVSTQEVIELLLQLESGNVPQLVLFYDGVNDEYAAYQSGRPEVHMNLSAISARFEERKSAVSFVEWLKTSYSFLLSERFAARLRQEAKTSPKIITYETMGIDTTTLADSVAQMYLANYKTVKALSQEYGFKYFFFWQPVIWFGNKPLTSEEQAIKLGTDPARMRLSNSIYRTIELVASEAEYENLYYLGDIFDKYTSLIWIDGWHVTPVGNQLIAQKMLDVVAARNQGHKVKPGR